MILFNAMVPLSGGNLCYWLSRNNVSFAADLHKETSANKKFE